jgi:sodium-dependent dicarboxylate transporter 2/3/5
MISAVSLFVIPSKTSTEGRILDKETIRKIPWGVLLLIGGSIALSAAFQDTGLNNWIAHQITFLEGAPQIVVIFAVVAAAMIITQVLVNTGAAALMIPIAATLASVLGIPPLLLMVPAAIGVSYALVLPIATPPNMIVLGSGYVTTKQLVKIGLPLILILLPVVTILTTVLTPLVFGR